MPAPDQGLSAEAITVLRHTLRMFHGRRSVWGTTNLYTARLPLSPLISDLVGRGYLSKSHETPLTAFFKATDAGMRAVNLGPAGIERASKL